MKSHVVFSSTILYSVLLGHADGAWLERFRWVCN